MKEDRQPSQETVDLIALAEAGFPRFCWTLVLVAVLVVASLKVMGA